MVGDTIKVNGIDLLILDERGSDIFVLAYNLLDKDTVFHSSGNNYRDSILKKKCDEWIENAGFTNVKVRDIDLVTMDGYDRGSLIVKAAPLTFDEYRKYAQIIQKKITHDFWLVTGWSHEGWGADLACGVNSDGKPNGYTYGISRGFAPAFVLDKAELTSKKLLSEFTIEELTNEIARRALQNNLK